MATSDEKSEDSVQPDKSQQNQQWRNIQKDWETLKKKIDGLIKWGDPYNDPTNPNQSTKYSKLIESMSEFSSQLRTVEDNPGQDIKADKLWLSSLNKELKQENADLKQENADLKQENADLTSERDELNSRFSELMIQVSSDNRDKTAEYTTNIDAQPLTISTALRQLKNGEFETVVDGIASHIRDIPSNISSQPEKRAYIRGILSQEIFWEEATANKADQTLLRVLKEEKPGQDSSRQELSLIFSNSKNNIDESLDSTNTDTLISTLTESLILRFPDHFNQSSDLHEILFSIQKKIEQLDKELSEMQSNPSNELQQDTEHHIKILFDLQKQIGYLIDLQKQIENLRKRGRKLAKDVRTTEGELIFSLKNTPFNSEEHETTRDSGDNWVVLFTIFPGYKVAGKWMNKAFVYARPPSVDTAENTMN